MADQRKLILANSSFTTRLNGADGVTKFYVLDTGAVGTSPNTIDITLREFDLADITQATPLRTAVFAGRYNLNVAKNRVAIVVKDTTLTKGTGAAVATQGFSTFRLIIRSNVLGPLRDKVSINKSPAVILDAIDAVPEKEKADLLRFEENVRPVFGGMAEDPDAESFSRQGTGTSAPTAGSGTNSTGNIAGTAIKKNSVVVKVSSTGLVLAVDNGSGMLMDLSGNDIANTSVTYSDPWNVTTGGITANTVYMVEAMRA
ncbi:MAG: hypothetical protein QM703_10230 [Gemmatales bacterium]